MKKSWSETVIIPHPNEQKKLSDLQKIILNTIEKEIRQREENMAPAEDREIWAPSFPLYVNGFSENEENSKNLAEWKREIQGCRLTNLRLEKDRIFLEADIKGKDKNFSGLLQLACRIEGNEKTDINKDIFEKAQTFFPLLLPVFRLAAVDFTEEDCHREWTVRDSVWIKKSV